jgi:hypothetical protein
VIRLPFAPLQCELERRHGRELSTGEIALIIGVSREQIRLYRVAGLSYWRADEYAIHILDSHPIHIWGLEEWQGALGDSDQR